MATVLIDEQCVIPAGIATLADFRRWVVSPEFPATGRIDWVASRIEVDMSPEDLFTHGTLKSEIVRCLANLAKETLHARAWLHLTRHVYSMYPCKRFRFCFPIR